jgi:preprotein translocase subunit SecA
MFAAMMDGIKEESVGFLFNLEVQIEEEAAEEVEVEEVEEPMRRPVPAPDSPREAPQIRAKGLDRPQQPAHLSYSAPTEGGDVEVKGEPASNADDPYATVGRNADCPCGSGKKFKKCHGAPGGPTGLTARIS